MTIWRLHCSTAHHIIYYTIQDYKPKKNRWLLIGFFDSNPIEISKVLFLYWCLFLWCQIYWCLLIGAFFCCAFFCGAFLHCTLHVTIRRLHCSTAHHIIYYTIQDYKPKKNQMIVNRVFWLEKQSHRQNNIGPVTWYNSQLAFVDKLILHWRRFTQCSLDFRIPVSYTHLTLPTTPYV